MPKRSFLFKIIIDPPSGDIVGIWPHIMGSDSRPKLIYWRGREVVVELTSKAYINDLEIQFLTREGDVVKKIDGEIISYELLKEVT